VGGWAGGLDNPVPYPVEVPRACVGGRPRRRVCCKGFQKVDCICTRALLVCVFAFDPSHHSVALIWPTTPLGCATVIANTLSLQSRKKTAPSGRVCGGPSPCFPCGWEEGRARTSPPPLLWFESVGRGVEGYRTRAPFREGPPDRLPPFYSHVALRRVFASDKHILKALL